MLSTAVLVSLLSLAAGIHAAPAAAATPSSGSWNPSADPSYKGPQKAVAPKQEGHYVVSLGPRPYYLVDNMTASPLKSKLESCANLDFEVTGFTVGHRGGGTLQFPEETVQSEQAGARMGAGILECDVSFTRDRGLVCRHSLCDLHTTTDILLKPELVKKCTKPFTPANASAPADALCCTSDISTAEYRTLCGKQDGFNASAKNVRDYQRGAPDWRTELYDTCGKLLTLDEYIDFVEHVPGPQRNFTPELKTPPPQVPMPFHGYTQQQYAQDFVDAFRRKGIAFDRIWPQSFLVDDILYWLRADRAFARQAIFLQEYDTPAELAAGAANFSMLRRAGLNILGPSLPMLVTAGGPRNRSIVPTAYARQAQQAGFDFIAWTFERSGPLATVKSRGEYYFSSLADVVSYDGQYYDVLDVLANQIGIKGLFTDWAATTTYFANCFGLKGPVGGSYK